MSCLIKTSSEYDRVNGLIVETVSLLCKNGLSFSKQLKVQGVLAVTIDDNEIFLVHINESIDYTPDVELPQNMRSPFNLLQSKNYDRIEDQLGSDGDEEEEDYEDVQNTQYNHSAEFKEKSSDVYNSNNLNKFCESSVMSDFTKSQNVNTVKESRITEIIPINNKNHNNSIINNNNNNNNTSCTNNYNTEISENVNNTESSDNNVDAIDLNKESMGEFLVKSEVINVKSDDESKELLYDNASHSIYPHKNTDHSIMNQQNSLQCDDNFQHFLSNNNTNEEINESLFNSTDRSIYNIKNNTCYSGTNINNISNNIYHFGENSLNFQDFTKSRKRCAPVVNTKEDRYKVAKWMQQETQLNGMDRIVSRAVKAFPDIFRAPNEKSNLQKASRWHRNMEKLIITSSSNDDVLAGST